ncbi:hypothetical protein ACFWA6_03740 [Streptomyces sp. NPDC060020]|uniref:hypothetical protein n=1 Tax=Streptomyces sp. NPDC060020 TaxID=3347038 RepID=UPI0036B1EA5D
MNEIPASELLAALEADSEVNSLVRNAVISGVHFKVGLELIPAARLLGICLGRVKAAQRHGRPTVGVAECLASLAGMGERVLLVAFANDREGSGYYFKIYLDPDPLKVIGCFGVNVSPEGDPIAGPA